MDISFPSTSSESSGEMCPECTKETEEEHTARSDECEATMYDEICAFTDRTSVPATQGYGKSMEKSYQNADIHCGIKLKGSIKISKSELQNVLTKDCASSPVPSKSKGNRKAANGVFGVPSPEAPFSSSRESIHNQLSTKKPIDKSSTDFGVRSPNINMKCREGNISVSSQTSASKKTNPPDGVVSPNLSQTDDGSECDCPEIFTNSQELSIGHPVKFHTANFGHSESLILESSPAHLTQPVSSQIERKRHGDESGYPSPDKKKQKQEQRTTGSDIESLITVTSTLAPSYCNNKMLTACSKSTGTFPAIIQVVESLSDVPECLEEENLPGNECSKATQESLLRSESSNNGKSNEIVSNECNAGPNAPRSLKEANQSSGSLKQICSDIKKLNIQVLSVADVSPLRNSQNILSDTVSDLSEEETLPSQKAPISDGSHQDINPETRESCASPETIYSSSSEESLEDVPHWNTLRNSLISDGSHQDNNPETRESCASPETIYSSSSEESLEDVPHWNTLRNSPISDGSHQDIIPETLESCASPETIYLSSSQRGSLQDVQHRNTLRKEGKLTVKAKNLSSDSVEPVSSDLKVVFPKEVASTLKKRKCEGEPSLSLDSNLNIHLKQQNIDGCNSISETFIIHVTLVEVIAPSLEELVSASTDLVRGFCGGSCLCLTPYSDILWQERNQCRRPFCPLCAKNGQMELLMINFWFKLLLKDAKGKTYDTVVSREYAAEFLGCSLDKFLDDESIRKLMIKALKRLIDSQHAFDMTMIRVENCAGIHYRAR